MVLTVLFTTIATSGLYVTRAHAAGVYLRQHLVLGVLLQSSLKFFPAFGLLHDRLNKLAGVLVEVDFSGCFSSLRKGRNPKGRNE